MHKMKGHVSSGLLFNFWLLLTVFAIPQLLREIRDFDSENSSSWHQFQYFNYITYFSLITAMLVLNCFADKHPTKTSYQKSSNPSPERSASFLRQIFFQWFDHVAIIGWKRPITEKDIYDINPDDASRELVPPFDKYFNESVEKGRR
jgi:ATP-binding cassette, subfamily C (CFTR/MRP), member 1